MKNKYCLLLLSFFLLACQEKNLSEAVYNKGINIIPVPGELTLQRGNFIIDGQTKFVVSHDSLCSVAAFYANKMRRSTGFPISVETDGDKNVIRLEINDSMNESDEAYHLMVSEDGARVVSKYGKSLALKQGWHPIKIEQISNFIGGWNSQQRNNGAVSIRGYSDNTWKSISDTQLKF